MKTRKPNIKIKKPGPATVIAGEIYYSFKDFISKFPSSLENEKEFHNFLINYKNYFDKPDLLELEEIISSGYIDFTHKIFQAPFYEIIGNPLEKNALEIGFGSGRLMNAACKFFNHVYGIELHQNFKKVKSFLGKRGNKNYTLIHQNTCEMDIKKHSIDFIYSYSVFDHIESWSDIEYYLNLLNKWLSPDGCGIFYFRHAVYDNMATHRDCGYSNENGIPVVFTYLRISSHFIVNKLENLGFEIIGAGNSKEKLWNPDDTSNLFYIVFQKQNKEIIFK